MRTIWKVLLLAGLSSTAWAAEPNPGAQMLPGTWECYGPGQPSPRTPPIVYFGGVRDEAGAASIFIDGFARTVNGRATLLPDAGTLRVAAGGSSLVLHDFSQMGTSARMMLEREGVGTYHCLRLPRLSELAGDSGPSAPRLQQGVSAPAEGSDAPEKAPSLR